MLHSFEDAIIPPVCQNAYLRAYTTICFVLC